MSDRTEEEKKEEKKEDFLPSLAVKHRKRHNLPRNLLIKYAVGMALVLKFHPGTNLRDKYEQKRTKRPNNPDATV